MLIDFNIPQTGVIMLHTKAFAILLLKSVRHLLFILAFFGFTAAAHAMDAPDGEAQLSRLGVTQFEEPLIATVPTTPEEDGALLSAIQQYQQRKADDYRALTDFLVAQPKSG
ncbi:MAG: hypothetical protein ACREEM_33175 [Blastocatellia bacterium]